MERLHVVHPPTVSKVTKLIQCEGWTANYPQPEDIVGKWKPAPKCQLKEDPRILKRVVDQKWSGIAIKDFEDKRGQGVVATRRLVRGSVICDYHGEIIPAKQGKKMMQNITDDMGYLFFLLNTG
uniref:Si:dkey-23a23.2 n=1 Tax=Nothobranchius furzeri TaxID=105023 RepID=A0A1A8ARP7_NOTFU